MREKGALRWERTRGSSNKAERDEPADVAGKSYLQRGSGDGIVWAAPRGEAVCPRSGPQEHRKKWDVEESG